MRIPTLTRWRAFASSRYRPFQAIAVGQAFTISFGSDALFVPLLLHLGAPAWWVMVVGSVPVSAAALQAFAPQILLRMHGDLRRLTLALSIFETRGFLHAATAIGLATGLIGATGGIVLVSLTVIVAQSCGSLFASNMTLWTAVVLPEEERRLVGPRMAASTTALSTLLLLPSGMLLDIGLRHLGVWAYVDFFLVGGIVTILTPLAVAKLPYPGRVLVRTGDEVEEPLPEPFVRFATAATIASVGQGLIPYLTVYSIEVLGASPGFAVFLVGFGSAGSLLGSLGAGSFLLTGSSSRLLRVSFLGRTMAALLCVGAFPGNPAALPFLLAGAALFNGAGWAGALAANERLYRLSPPHLRVRCQSRYVAATSTAFAAGALSCAAGLTLVGPLGWPVYTALFAGSGLSRAIAGWRTDVSASWHSPVIPAS